MSTGDLVTQVSLWIAVIGLSLWVGGTVYQMMVIVPIFSKSPDSVRAFFGGTDFKLTIRRFFGPRFMVVRNTSLIVALVAGWHLPQRSFLILTIACQVVVIVFTFSAIYSVNNVLVDRAGAGLTDDGVRELTKKWILYDRLRFVVGVVGYLSLLQAFSMPISP
jgi:hypothetical protein